MLTRRIDLGEHQNVRVIECAAKIVPQKLRARVAVRLKQNQQTLVSASASRFERGTNLGGMMTVIVNQRNACIHTLHFEAAADARKLLKPGSNQIRRHI